MPTTPPTISAAPAAPQRGIKATFNQLLDAFLTWLVAAVTQFGAVAANVYNNAVEAFNSASIATAAADTAVAAAGAVQWVSGTTYTKGYVVWSPADLRTYRRITAGAGATDPSLDAANWRLLSQEPAAFKLLATATVGSSVANIDFLSVFSSAFDRYVIELNGIVYPANGALRLVMAKAGAADTGAVYGGSTQVLITNSGATGTVANISIDVRNANGSAQKSIGARGSFTNTTPALQQVSLESTYDWAGAASGFRLYFTTGNFTAGTVRVYGLANA